ncbi:hypothetical protein MMC26_004859 [Xylographa opegraphella]|nr:hypothetical protein [Xylographa opegraphella]
MNGAFDEDAAGEDAAGWNTAAENLAVKNSAANGSAATDTVAEDNESNEVVILIFATIPTTLVLRMGAAYVPAQPCRLYQATSTVAPGKSQSSIIAAAGPESAAYAHRRLLAIECVWIATGSQNGSGLCRDARLGNVNTGGKRRIEFNGKIAHGFLAGSKLESRRFGSP